MDTHGNKETFLVLRAPASVNADGNGTGIDLAGYEGQIAIHQSVGTPTGTTPTLDAKIQHSSDNAAWTDVTGGAFTQVTEAGAQKLVLNRNDLKRYIRHVVDVSGTTPVFPMSVVATVIPKAV